MPILFPPTAFVHMWFGLYRLPFELMQLNTGQIPSKAESNQ
jgi:hypothetical protein